MSIFLWMYLLQGACAFTTGLAPGYLTTIAEPGDNCPLMMSWVAIPMPVPILAAQRSTACAAATYTPTGGQGPCAMSSSPQPPALNAPIIDAPQVKKAAPPPAKKK